jgi:hypothetical protein
MTLQLQRGLALISVKRESLMTAMIPLLLSTKGGQQLKLQIGVSRGIGHLMKSVSRWNALLA